MKTANLVCAALAAFNVVGAGAAGAAGAVRTTPTVAAQSLTVAPLVFPPGAEAREARLLPKIGPQTKAWVKREAAKTAKATPVSDAGIRPDISELGDLSAMDIEEIVFLVMMEATRSQDADLRDLMAQMEDTNKKKAALRDEMARLKAEQAQAKAALKASYDARIKEDKAKQDSLASLSEILQVRLQKYQERRSRFFEILSDLLKKFSDTEGTISGNLK